jgi:hypothetical protein
MTAPERGSIPERRREGKGREEKRRPQEEERCIINRRRDS